jgi:hypothetical protein
MKCVEMIIWEVKWPSQEGGNFDELKSRELREMRAVATCVIATALQHLFKDGKA